MSNQSPDARVHEQLARAVISGLLPDRAHEQAEKLLTRLETPVRLALLGLPKSGKSTLLNLLIGQSVLDEHTQLPTCEFVYGRIAQAICTLSDGTKTALDGVDLDTITALSPAFVEIRMPLPALKKISVLEVVAPADPNALHRASQWAAKRCDIAIWCTAEYAADEQRIWAQMPDSLKDHALLMITRADLLQQIGRLDEVRSAAQTAAVGEFNKIIPIAAKQAIAARGADGAVNKDLFRQSGGTSLISAVLKKVEQGQRSALDLAEVLLLQNEDVLARVDDVLAAGEAEEAREQQAAELDSEEDFETSVEEIETTVDLELDDVEDEAFALADDDEPEDVPATQHPQPVARHAQPTMSPLRRREAPPTPKMDSPEAERVAVGIARLRNIAARRAEEGLQSAQAQEVLPETRSAYEEAIATLEHKAAALAERLDDLGEEAPATVMTQAVDDLNWLCDFLNGHGDNSDPSLQRARDTAFDAADLVQLMQMEKRDSAAIEALSLMLQVKRELQADLAA